MDDALLVRERINHYRLMDHMISILVCFCSLITTTGISGMANESNMSVIYLQLSGSTQVRGLDAKKAKDLGSEAYSARYI